MRDFRSMFPAGRLRGGTDDALLGIEVEEYDASGYGDVPINLCFRSGTSVEHMVRIRDRVRRNYYEIANELYDDPEDMPVPLVHSSLEDEAEVEELVD